MSQPTTTVAISRALGQHLLAHLTQRLQARPRTEAAEVEAEHLMRLRTELATALAAPPASPADTNPKEDHHV